MSYLQKCIDRLKSETTAFHDDWFSDFNFTNESNNEDQREILRYGIYLSKVYSDMFKYLNLSILSGEYVEDQKYSEKISELSEIVSNALSQVETPERQLQTELQHIFIHSFQKPFNSAINGLKKLAHVIRKNYHNHFDNWLFFAENENTGNERYNMPLNPDGQRILNLFWLNVNVSLLDLELSFNKQALSKLILMRRQLKELKSQLSLDYLAYIQDKCEYLILKILYRFQKDNSSYLYSIDYQDKELSIEELNPGVFSDFDNRTKKHYEIKANSYSDSETHRIKDKSLRGKSISCKDLHQLIKNYKDHEKIYDKLVYWSSKIEVCYDVPHSDMSDFDSLSFTSLKNYSKNNEFSLFLETQSPDLDEVRKKLREIDKIQAETSIKNYFPYIKHCYFLDKVITEEFNLEKDNLDRNKIEKCIEELEQSRKKAYEYFEWCKNRHFMAFRLPFKECKIELSESKDLEEIFLCSSFVLPINFEDVSLKLEEISRRLQKHKTQFEVHENLLVQSNKIKSVKEKMDSYERRSIEILGIFTAVVLFVSGSIQIFTIEGITMNQALKFMLVFSYSLVLFIFLVWLVTRPSIDHLTAVHWVFFVLLAVVTVSAYIFIYKDPNNLPKKIPEKQTIQYDKEVERISIPR